MIGERTAQRTFFAPPRDREPGELYREIVAGSATASRTAFALEPHARISTNTYFGRFPASHWQRWTDVPRVTLRVRARGSGMLFLMASDSLGRERTVDSARVHSAESEYAELTAELNRFADGGGLWMEAATENRRLRIDDVRWLVPGPGRGHGAVVAMCTHNRPEECVATLRTLAADQECLDALDAVFVVDQGSDPAPVERAGLGGKLRYVRQPNLGGAGGFARGLSEAMTEGRRPHVVLMDDDIVLEPETVLRLIAFAELTVAPAIVGSQMLQLLHPHRLQVAAEYADLPRLRAGRPVPGAFQDVDLREHKLDLHVDGEYNAWWTCLVPPEVVESIGLPMPMFFQWDDIEYGLRARAAGHPSITLAGAGVWHADFWWKDWDDWPRYFSVRNGLIVAALHGDFQGTAAFLAGELARCLVSMRYALAATLILAIEDFLRGPEVLSDGGAQAVAAVRKLRLEHPETQLRPVSSVASTRTVRSGPEPSRPGLVMAKRIAWHLLGKSHGEAAVSARDSEWWHVALFDRAVVTDPSQQGVKIRQRDRALARKLATEGAKTLLRFHKEADQATERYRAALPNLTTKDSWTPRFNKR
ncbi:glycosyltransferase [Amycolatopsis thermoflava]|uniref:glycosyltransferase n=1 Tax=Amycolatopsis thermoflava TaxID=84480 RepID=UPI003F4A0375